VDHVNQFDRYKSTADEPSCYHEAGYDSLIPNEGRLVLF
jgi:hypothetical protein